MDERHHSTVIFTGCEIAQKSSTGHFDCHTCSNYYNCIKRKAKFSKAKNGKRYRNQKLHPTFHKVIIVACVFAFFMLYSFHSRAAQKETVETGTIIPEITSASNLDGNTVGVAILNSNDNSEDIEETEPEEETTESLIMVDDSSLLDYGDEASESVKNEEENLGFSLGYKYDISQEDILTMEKVVYREARGECYEGQVAVAAVILNRLADGNFGSTIDSIVSGQFASPYGVTQADLDAHPLIAQAVDEALRGVDPTREVFPETGALYFYNPDGVYGEAAANRANISQYMDIGNHRFHISFD